MFGGGSTAQQLGASGFAPRGPKRPAVESWTLTAEAVERWVKGAQTGEQLVYAHGPNLIDGAVAARVRELAAISEVLPRQRRAADGSLDYFVIRNRVRVVRPPRQGPAAIVLGDHERAILMKLKEAARTGQRCPSDSALGFAVGLRPDQAKWQLRKLTQKGLIKTRVVTTPTNPKFRIVTIVETGFETAAPGEPLSAGPSNSTEAGL